MIFGFVIQASIDNQVIYLGYDGQYAWTNKIKTAIIFDDNLDAFNIIANSNFSELIKKAGEKLHSQKVTITLSSLKIGGGFFTATKNIE